MAISPPNMIILKNPIEGYNNKLRIARWNMVFGLNIKLNYSGNGSQPKKVHQKLHI